MSGAGMMEQVSYTGVRGLAQEHAALDKLTENFEPASLSLSSLSGLIRALPAPNTLIASPSNNSFQIPADQVVYVHVNPIDNKKLGLSPNQLQRLVNHLNNDVPVPTSTSTKEAPGGDSRGANMTNGMMEKEACTHARGLAQESAALDVTENFESTFLSHGKRISK